MASVTLQIPEELETKLDESSRDLGDSLRLWAAFSLCQRGRLSASLAARLAGLTYADFLDAAVQAEVELFPVDFDELQEAIARADSLGRQRLAGDPIGSSRPA